MRIFLTTTVLLTFCLAAFAAGRPGGHDLAEQNGSRIFATVGGVVIPAEEFEANFHAGVRQRFYHGSVPKEQLAAFRREVAGEIIDRILLLQEGERRGIEPDMKWVDSELGAWAGRIAASPDPDRSRKVVREQLLGDSVILQLKAQVEDIPEISEEQLRAWYREHPDKFTTPARLRVSLILLKVEPWASGEVWEAAWNEAQRIIGRLHDGEDFAALASLHSGDGSAAQGGDLGYLHQGMLAPEAQEVVDSLSPGEVSGPVQLLQGFAIFRLEERIAPTLNDYEQVAERARDLLHRELQEQARERLLIDLRTGTTIEINQAVLATDG
jgi:hypothetical protein